MPKLGMETIRRADLVDATILEIGRAGTLEVTVGQIARRAGVSSALAHHYFGSKEQMFAAAMRHTLQIFRAEVHELLAAARGPRARVEAIIRANFSDTNFRPGIIAAWLNFYVQSRRSREAQRLLAVYQSRLRTNLICELRPLLGAQAEQTAQGIAAMIDGLYIRQSLVGGPADGAASEAVVMGYLDTVLDRNGDTVIPARGP